MIERFRFRRLGKVTLLAFLLLLLLLPAALSAQKWESALSFDYARLDVTKASEVFGKPSFYGGSASLAYDLSQRWSLVADAGFYDLHKASLKAGDYSVLFGPRLTARGDKLDYFVQGLYGLSRFNHDNAPTVALGAGVDYKFGKHFSVRLLEADYFLTRYGSRTQNGNLRASTGVVLKF